MTFARWRAVALYLVLAASVGASAPVHRVAADAPFTVQEWIVLGPFANPWLDYPTAEGFTRAGFADDLLSRAGGEAGAVLGEGRNVDGLGELKRLRTGPDGVADVTQLWGDGEHRVAYLFTWVEVDRAETLTFLFGSDDSAAVWVNGEHVQTAWSGGGRGPRPRQNHFRTELRPGRNALLVKLEQFGPGWALHLEILPRERAPAELASTWQPAPFGRTLAAEGDEYLIEIGAGSNYDPTLFTDVRQVLRLENDAGEEVWQDELATGETRRVRVPHGMYRLTAQAPRVMHPKNIAVYAGFEFDRFRRRIQGQIREHFLPNASGATAGWFALLHQRLEAARQDPEDALMAAYAAQHWRQRLASNPDAWREQRGGFEWAYFSPAEAAGLPFSLRVPDNYDPSRSWPLVVNLHGAGGSHRIEWGTPHKSDNFELYADGRGPNNGYSELSERDVLDAVEFVRQHWSIDPDQVHLTGGSMGGHGTYILASRHPERWATAVPWAGTGTYQPTENLAGVVPLYALHSVDDWVVPISGSRLAVDWITRHGGEAHLEETTGYGHRFWLWDEGRRRMLDWRADRQRALQPDRAIQFTAMDQGSRGTAWLQIEEWGSESAPARFRANPVGDNHIDLELTNVGRLRLDLDAAPVDRARELTVEVNKREVGRWPAPLPRFLDVVAHAEAWTLQAANTAGGMRPYFPGGAAALYQGDPLMIVWGTTGPASTTARLEQLAQAGRTKSRFQWAPARLGAGMSHGAIPAKPDYAVTAEDQARYNLLLLGTPEENRLVAELAERLPLQVDTAEGRVAMRDGPAWSWAGRSFGLLAVHPDQPQRLLYWWAAAEPESYSVWSPVMALQLEREPGPDFLLVNVAERRLISARRYAGGWDWEVGYRESGQLGEQAADAPARVAEQMRRLGRADFALLDATLDPVPAVSFDPATRWMDLRALAFGQRLVVSEITGHDLLAAVERLEKAAGHRLSWWPEPNAQTIDRDARYRVVLGNQSVRPFVVATQLTEIPYRLVEETMRDVLATARTE